MSSSDALWTIELFIRVFEIHGDTVVAYDMKIRVTRSYLINVPFAALGTHGLLQAGVTHTIQLVLYLGVTP